MEAHRREAIKIFIYQIIYISGGKIKNQIITGYCILNCNMQIYIINCPKYISLKMHVYLRNVLIFSCFYTLLNNLQSHYLFNTTMQV